MIATSSRADAYAEADAEHKFASPSSSRLRRRPQWHSRFIDRSSPRGSFAAAAAATESVSVNTSASGSARVRRASGLVRVPVRARVCSLLEAAAAASTAQGIGRESCRFASRRVAALPVVSALSAPPKASAPLRSASHRTASHCICIACVVPPPPSALHTAIVLRAAEGEAEGESAEARRCLFSISIPISSPSRAECRVCRVPTARMRLRV